MNPEKGSVMSFRPEHLLYIALATFILAMAVSTVRISLEERRRDKAHKLRLENEILPKFEAEFGCRPSTRPSNTGWRAKVEGHMANLAYVVGQAAIAQERVLMDDRAGLAYQRRDAKQAVDGAKAKWSQAKELIKEVDRELYCSISHWSEDEPYASHREAKHADIS